MYISIILCNLAVVILFLTGTISTANAGDENETNGHWFCDGKNRDYEDLENFSAPDEGECYGICEEMSKGLACDIEKRPE